MFDSIKKKASGYIVFSEKYVKTDMAYLIQSASWTTIGQAVNILITFLLSIIFASFLSKESYGAYTYILTLVGIFGLAGLPGINTSLKKSVSAGDDGGILKTAFKEKIKWNFLSAIISLGVSIYYFVQGNVLLGSSLLLAAFFFPLVEGADVYEDFLVGRKLFKLNTFYFLATRLFFLAAIFAVSFLTEDVFFVLLVYFATYALFRLFFYFSTASRFSKNNNFSSQLSGKKKEMMDYAKNLSLMNILSQITGQIDKVLVFHFLNGANLAVYSFAMAPVQQMKSIINPLDTILFPKFVKRDFKEIRKMIFRKIFFLWVLIFAMIAVYIAISPYFYGIFFPQYGESVFYSRIYSISLIFSAIIFPKTALEAHAKIKSLYLTKIIQPIIKMALLIFFTLYFGILGTLMALILSQLFNFLFTLSLFMRESR